MAELAAMRIVARYLTMSFGGDVLTALPELVYRLQPIRDEIAAPGGPRESLPSDEI